MSMESWDPRFKQNLSTEKPYEQLFPVDTSYSSLNGDLLQIKKTDFTSKSLVLNDTAYGTQNRILESQTREQQDQFEILLTEEYQLKERPIERKSSDEPLKSSIYQLKLNMRVSAETFGRFNTDGASRSQSSCLAGDRSQSLGIVTFMDHSRSPSLRPQCQFANCQEEGLLQC